MRGSLLRTTPSQSGPNLGSPARLKAGAVRPGRPMSVRTPDVGKRDLQYAKEARNGRAVVPDSETGAVTLKSCP